MCAEAPPPARRVVVPRAIPSGLFAAPLFTPAFLATALLAAALLAAALAAGCRTAGAGGKVDLDPALIAIVRPAEAAEIAALPDGPGKTLVTERCLLCHGAALITQQRKDAAAWGRTVTQMRTWGTPIQDSDQAALVAYLTDHFGPVSGVRR